MIKTGKERILISGGAGNLGTKLIKGLLKKYPNLNVHCLDVQKPKVKLPHLVSHELSILSHHLNAIFKSMKFDIVFHLIGIMSPDKNRSDEIYKIEIGGLKKLLKLCSMNTVEHFVFVSSGAVYGYKDGLPNYITEKQPVESNNPITYGRNKVIAE